VIRVGFEYVPAIGFYDVRTYKSGLVIIIKVSDNIVATGVQHKCQFCFGFDVFVNFKIANHALARKVHFGTDVLLAPSIDILGALVAPCIWTIHMGSLRLSM
jgi:hypothetical protein